MRLIHLALTKTLFTIDVEDPNVCKVIDICMAKAWRGFRGKLHGYFKKIGGQEDLNKAKTTRPSDPDCQVSQEDWEYLCDMWFDPKYKT
ncbi:hypothetical protein OSB04_016994 [Centaurea solstitialis]|uniref:Uncharacterized protein n=1 Tax=Centaurea solstitialis TaxID=347529 RepID=A0AA38WKB1_9ASTR|nr:hypothetical protein OSB04_016994 [Centaurea solstitialis]